jgi:hypothetical protein
MSENLPQQLAEQNLKLKEVRAELENLKLENSRSVNKRCSATLETVGECPQQLGY